jgi:hypothetical protein
MFWRIFILFNIIFSMTLAFALYYSSSYKVDSSLVEFGYDVIINNQNSILDKATDLIEDSDFKKHINKVRIQEGVNLNSCKIVPVSSFIDRLRARESFYVTYYSGSDSRNLEIYILVYVYDSGDIFVYDTGKIWH